MEEYQNEEKKVIEKKTDFYIVQKQKKALHKLVDDYIAFIKTTKFDLENIYYAKRYFRKKSFFNIE